MKHTFLRTLAALLCFFVLLAPVGCRTNPDKTTEPEYTEVEREAIRLFTEKWSALIGGELIPDRISVKGCDPYNPSSSMEDIIVQSWLYKTETKNRALEYCKALDPDSVKPGGLVFLDRHISIFEGCRVVIYDAGLKPIIEFAAYHTGEVEMRVYNDDGDAYALHGTGIDYKAFEVFYGTHETEADR